MADLKRITRPFDRCLVQRDDGQWFIFPDHIKGSIGIMSKHQIKRYGNFKMFCFNKTKEWAEPHDANTDDPKLQKQWLNLIESATDRINLHREGEEAPSKILERTYRALPCPPDKSRYVLMPHTREVYEYLLTLNSITENKLRKIFTDWYFQNKERIKARQKNAWRFFQCHRPYLLEQGFLKILEP